MNKQKLWFQVVLYMVIVGVGLVADALVHKSWPSLASVLLVIALALWDKNTSGKHSSRAVYKGYLKLIFPNGFHKPQAMAVVYGVVIGGFVGGMIVAGYSNHQSAALISFGVFGGAIAGTYILLQLIPITRPKKGR